MTFDYLPRELLEGSSISRTSARVLVLDKWTCNGDGRQAMFCCKTPRSQHYHATFIDQGYCFNAGEWTFPDYTLRGRIREQLCLRGCVGWDSFEPALSRAEEMDAQTIWRWAADIPEEWYEEDLDGLNRLVEALHHRRG